MDIEAEIILIFLILQIDIAFSIRYTPSKYQVCSTITRCVSPLFGELDDLSRCDDSYFSVERTESVGVFLRVDIDDGLRAGEIGVFVHLGYGIGFYRLFGAASDSENLRGQRLSVGRTDHTEILLRKNDLSLRLVQIRRQIIRLTAS